MAFRKPDMPGRPDQGSVKMGTNLEIGYFDQIQREHDRRASVAGDLRQALDEL